MNNALLIDLKHNLPTSRRGGVAIALAAVATLASIGQAAGVTLSATDTAGTTSFNAGTHWSDGQAPAAGNSYFVGTGFSLRTPFDTAADITFAGDSLTLSGTTASNAVLVIKNLTGITTTVNNLTLDGGQIQNGGTSTGAATTETLASNLITLGANGGFINAGASGRTLNITGPVTTTLGGLFTLTTNAGTINFSGALTGNGGLTANANGGFIGLTGTNTYTGNTIISGSTISSGSVAGAVRGNDGMNITSAGNLLLNSGVLESGVNITRSLGSGAGQISISGAAAGFAAVGAPVTVAIGGTDSPTALTWGSTDFNPTTLVLGDYNSNNTLTFANAIDNGGSARTILAASGTTTTQSVVSGVLSGSGAMTFTGTSTLTLAAANTFTGATTITGSKITSGIQTGDVKATDGVGIPTASNLSLSSGILATGTNFTRALGTDAGQVSITGAASGFSAVDAPVTVAIGGTASPSTLTWGSTTFNPTVLVLNDAAANNTLTLSNPIDLGTSGRTIFATAGTNATQSILNGVISGSGGLSFYGTSTIVLNAANTYTGGTTIGQFLVSGSSATTATVRATASQAFGTGGVTIGLSGNGVVARLELANNISLPNEITLPSRTASNVAIENVSGTNTIAGTISINSGGSFNLIQSDAGTLVLSGTGTVNPGITLQSLTGARTVTLQGAGNGVVSGIIRDSNNVSGASIAITKAGAGTWTFTNANTYTGATTVSAGTLQFGDGTSGHNGSIAGTSIVDNGTVAFNPFGTVTSPYTISGTGGVSKIGTGTLVLNTANTYTGTTSISGGTLKATAAAYNSNLLAGSAGVDLTGAAGSLVLDYTGTASPVSTVKDLLTTAYASNFASGQIKSSTLAAGQTIGYGDDGASAVTVRVTLPGDANLDGQVNFNDFLLLQANFGQNDTRFDQGNFNYDGATNFNDFLLLQANFGQSITGAAVPVTASEVAAMTAFANAVPEPASLAVLGLAGTLLSQRRRRVSR